MNIPISRDDNQLSPQEFYTYFQEKLGTLPIGEAALVLQLLGMEFTVTSTIESDDEAEELSDEELSNESLSINK